jgi:4-hydroxy-4-methyl-2-oxoglutarate aldolase
LLVGGPFAGPALTVELPAGDNLGLHLALEKAEPGSVICAGSRGAGDYGVFGEILQEAGRGRGIVGFAIDDGIRDLARLDPPPSVAARGLSARGTSKRRLRRAVGSAVAIGGALVASGDWLVCDRDGVCVLPEERLEDALQRAEARLAREQDVRRHLAQGVTTRAVLGLGIDPPASVS